MQGGVVERHSLERVHRKIGPNQLGVTTETSGPVVVDAVDAYVNHHLTSIVLGADTQTPTTIQVNATCACRSTTMSSMNLIQAPWLLIDTRPNWSSWYWYL